MSASRFVPVWEGFFEHLPHFAGHWTALAAYLVLLKRTHLRGKGGGSVSSGVTLRMKDLQEEAGLSKQTLISALDWLRAPTTKDGEPLDPYVEVVKEGGQYTFRVLKFRSPYGARKTRVGRKPSTTYACPPDDWEPFA